MDLSTTYLGLKLSSPLMPGSSPMTHDDDTVRKLADHGAGAIVMHSIFQEQIALERTGRLWYEDMYSNTSAEAHAEYPNPQQFANTPRQYLDRICTLKRILGKVPLIASINCTTRNHWSDYATSIESSGADALELNIYLLPTNPEESSTDVEQRVQDIVKAVKGLIKIPIAVKLTPFYTSLPHVVRQLQAAGAAGLVLFNRFYQPDFAIRTRTADPRLDLSQMSDQVELRLRLRWLAILSPQTKLSLALTGGVHTGLDAVKGIMAGAHAIQIVSALLNAGPEYLDTIRESLIGYMRQLGAKSIAEIRGCMNHSHSSDPSAMERGGYMSILQKWNTHTHADEGVHSY